MERLQINGKVVVLVGAAGGLGSAAAALMARRGCSLCLSDKESVEETKEKCVQQAGLEQHQVLTVTGDITDGEVRRKLVQSTLEHFGKVDILVYAVGVLHLNDLSTLTEDSLDQTMSINLNAFIFLTQLFIPYLIPTKGNIVAVSSGAALAPIPQFLSYNLSKAALDMFIRYTAHELASSGVRVNAVRPGLIDTPMAFVNAHCFPNGDDREKYLSERGQAITMGRVGKPEEIAETIAFLASDAASYMTGEFVNVNGGGGLLGFSERQPDFDKLKQAQ